jgi:hypothetical protein
MDLTVDQEARRHLALLVRRFASGSITNDQLEEKLQDSEEHAILAIFLYGIWPLYHDFAEHKLTGQWPLSQEGRHWVGRIIIFLHNDYPYRYPHLTGLRQLPVMLLFIATLGRFGKIWLRYKWRGGDRRVWPFYSESEYAQALKHPVFMSGNAKKNAGMKHLAKGHIPD